MILSFWKHNVKAIGLSDNSGFSLIEALISIAIFSIGFMALTTTIWSSVQSTRTTAYADQSVFAGQDMIEILASIPIDHDNLDAGTHEITKDNETIEIEWEMLNPEDADGDGSADFKTIAIRVFSQGELKMQSYYRRLIN